jgi:hypothetical protein
MALYPEGCNLYALDNLKSHKSYILTCFYYSIQNTEIVALLNYYACIEIIFINYGLCLLLVYLFNDSLFTAYIIWHQIGGCLWMLQFQRMLSII